MGSDAVIESAALCGSYFIPPSMTGQSAVGLILVIATTGRPSVRQVHPDFNSALSHGFGRPVLNVQ